MKNRIFSRLSLLLITCLLILAGLFLQKAMNERQHTAALRQLTEKIRFDINTVSSHSTTMGAAILMGLISENAKKLLRHEILGDDPALNAELRSLLSKYEANIALLADESGEIVSYYNELNPSLKTTQKISFRPYWQLGIRGMHSVYPAVGTTDNGRGLYLAAPVHATTSASSDPIGVFVVRNNASQLDQTLADYPLPAMIVSADGVIFASNHPEWILKLSKPLSPSQQQSLQKNRQFGQLVASPENYQYLPFLLTGDRVSWNNRWYAVSASPLDWSDAQGEWKLVVLQDIHDWTPLWEQIGLIFIILLTMLSFYFIARLRTRLEQNALAAAYEQQQMQLRAKQHLKSLSDALPLAIFQITQNKRYDHWSYTYASAKTMDILGIDPTELMMGYRLVEQRIHPDDLARTLELFHAAIHQKTDFDFEQRIVRNKKIVWVQARAICSQTSEDEWVWNGYWRDISNQRLQTELLRQAKEAAEEATRTKSMFLANMSHEIRTPMNAVIGLAYLALKTELTPKQRDYLNRIHQAGTSLLGIINDILDFSKIEAHQLKLEQTDFNLDDVLANLSVMSSQRAHEKGLELLFDIPADIPRSLIGDPLRLGQILINLVSNAVKFTEQGYVHLQVQQLRRSHRQVELQFTVRDTGIGISPEQISHLFQAFTQADGSTTRRFGGTGLGLTIARHLVEQMGGAIHVTSQPNAGSQFIFTIKVACNQLENQKRHLIPRSITGLRILVVDDNQVASDILLAALQQLPVNPEVCNDPQNAWRKLQAAEQAGSPYHLLMTDWQMPDMDGLMLAKKANTLAHPPQTILVTAFSYDDVLTQAQEIGIKGFLTKPISQSQVVDSLMRIFAPPQGETSASLEQLQLPQFKQAKVLLAEDNPINQQIATEMMVACGIHADVAANGKEALALLFSHGSQHYDLIFMDLQMPEMDGHEATLTIRADSRFNELPIIAMTAHALQDERALCLSEGMNDHLAKPIDPELFYKLLTHYLGHRLTGHNQQVQQHTDALPDIDGLDSKSALQRINGNQTFYRQLLQQYCREQGDAVMRIKQVLHQQPEEAGRIAHSLKGVSANIGATRIAALAAQLENALHQHKVLSGSEPFIGELEQSLRHLCLQINAMTSTDNTTETHAVPVTDEELASLIKMIGDNDCSALDLFTRMEAGLKQRIPAAELDLINQHLQAFDFDLALVRLERFMLSKESASDIQSEAE